jgi:hypothetical protein
MTIIHGLNNTDLTQTDKLLFIATLAASQGVAFRVKDITVDGVSVAVGAAVGGRSSSSRVLAGDTNIAATIDWTSHFVIEQYGYSIAADAYTGFQTSVNSFNENGEFLSSLHGGSAIFADCFFQDGSFQYFGFTSEVIKTYSPTAAPTLRYVGDTTQPREDNLLAICIPIGAFILFGVMYLFYRMREKDKELAILKGHPSAVVADEESFIGVSVEDEAEADAGDGGRIRHEFYQFVLTDSHQPFVAAFEAYAKMAIVEIQRPIGYTQFCKFIAWLQQKNAKLRELCSEDVAPKDVYIAVLLAKSSRRGAEAVSTEELIELLEYARDLHTDTALMDKYWHGAVIPKQKQEEKIGAGPGVGPGVGAGVGTGATGSEAATHTIREGSDSAQDAAVVSEQKQKQPIEHKSNSVAAVISPSRYSANPQSTAAYTTTTPTPSSGSGSGNRGGRTEHAPYTATATAAAEDPGSKPVAEHIAPTPYSRIAPNKDTDRDRDRDRGTDRDRDTDRDTGRDPRDGTQAVYRPTASAHVPAARVTGPGGASKYTRETFVDIDVDVGDLHMSPVEPYPYPYDARPPDSPPPPGREGVAAGPRTTAHTRPSSRTGSNSNGNSNANSPGNSPGYSNGDSNSHSHSPLPTKVSPGKDLAKARVANMERSPSRRRVESPPLRASGQPSGQSRAHARDPSSPTYEEIYDNNANNNYNINGNFPTAQSSAGDGLLRTDRHGAPAAEGTFAMDSPMRSPLLRAPPIRHRENRRSTPKSTKTKMNF